jgi:hypothetical protein
MANIRISSLPTAQTITGAELVPVVQNGQTVQTTVSAITQSPALTQTFLTVGLQSGLPNSRYFSTGTGIGITDGGAQGAYTITLNGTSGSLETAGTGVIVKSAANTITAMSLVTSGNGISVTNGTGVSGNPTFALTGLALALANATGTGILALGSSSTISPVTITGTSNQIGVTGGDGSSTPTISLASNPVIPGTAGVTLPNGTTNQRGATTGQIRYNTTTSRFEGYYAGSWQTFGIGDGTLTSVSGTTGQINVSTVGGISTVSIATDPVIPGTGAIGLPFGTTAARPASPVNGALRYNTDTAFLEAYTNNAWGTIVSGSGVATFTAGTTGLTPSVPSSGGIILGGTLITSNGGTGASGTLVGYVYGNGTANMTASTTIPTTNLSGTIANAQLANSSITINGNTVSLGASTTVTASTTSTLTIGTGLTGTSFNGSVPVTIAIDSTVVTLSYTQTLTNKTLTLPVISQIVNTGTLTLPTSTDTLVGRATTDTLTNKSMSGSTNTFTNIPNSALTNNSITIGTTTVALGGTTLTPAGLTSVTVTQDPTTALQLATKQYVDSVAQGLSTKAPVLCATTTNITLSGEQTIDGVTTSASRVLVKNQSTASQNGIYLSGSGAWTRTTDANTWNQLVSAYVFVETGSTQADTGWVCTSDPGGTLEVTAVTWVQFSGAGTYSAGTGLTLAGTQFSITNTAATAGSYGSATQVGTFTVNAQGQITGATSTAIAIANTAVSGLGTMSTQNANNVSITGGTITGTPLSGSTVGGTTITASTQFSGPGTGLTGTATSLNIGGNAATVTNGVYTTGSYSNPGWITSILGSIVSGAVASATAATNVAGGSTGALPYQTGIGATGFLSLGTTNYVLTAGASAPTYVAQSTLSVGSASTATSATTATNLAGGIASQIPYQTGAGVTSFVANGTTGQVLTSNGTSAPSWTTISASVTVTDDTSTNSTRYPLFASSTSGSLSTVFTSSTKYQYNPSTGTLSTTIFSGSGASLTSLNASQVSSGTLGTGFGGTGLTAYATGDLLYASASNTLSRLAASTNGYVLTLAAGIPTWAASTGGVTSFSGGTTGLTPTSATTGAITIGGTLAVGNGGTGLTSLTAGYIPFGNGTGSLSSYSGLTYNATNNTLATPTLSITSITGVTPALTFNAANTNVASGASVAGSYLQSLFQNSSNTAGASVNYVLSNNLGTDSSYYGEFGMNSSTFSASTPGDFYSINNGIYFSGHDGDISVGSGNGYKTYLTYGTAGQSSHVINAAGAIGLSTNLGTTPALSGTTGYGTSGQVLTSGGSSAPPTWTTIGTGISSYSRTSATATAAQTTFTVSYSAPYIEVYLNGVLLNAADYTATNGTTVVLTTAANAGDILDFVSYNTTTIATPAGSNTQVQYNNGGALGASSSFTFTGNDLNIPFGTSGSATSSAKIALALAMIA